MAKQPQSRAQRRRPAVLLPADELSDDSDEYEKRQDAFAKQHPVDPADVPAAETAKAAARRAALVAQVRADALSVPLPPPPTPRLYLDDATERAMVVHTPGYRRLRALLAPVDTVRARGA